MATLIRNAVYVAILLLTQLGGVGFCSQGQKVFQISNFSLMVYYIPDLGRSVGDPPVGKVEASLGSLMLDGMKSGTYQVNSHSYSLKPGTPFKLSFSIAGKRKGGAEVSVFVNEGYRKKLLTKKRCRIDKGRAVVRFRTPKGDERANVWFSVMVPARESLEISDFQFTAAGGPVAVSNLQSIGIEFNAAMAVYRENQSGQCTIVGPQAGKRVIVTVTDGLSGTIVDAMTADVGAAGKLTVVIPTAIRGYYLLSVSSSDRQELGSSTYVVIRKDSVNVQRDSRFGLCLDEFAPSPAYPAGVSQTEMYTMYRDMGVGAVRLFSPAKPKVLSLDGVKYDFSALDSSLKLVEMNGFKVLVPMGSGAPSAVPDWLRTDVEAGNVSLTEGLFTQRLKKRVKKDKQPFLDIDKYEQFLGKVFGFLSDRAHFVEIWNEPGHKFSPEDTIRLASAARDVKDKLGSPFLLLGFSSTKGRGTGQGRDPERSPKFFQDVIRLGGADLVDGISYHSGHAFRFLGESHDPRNLETGFPARLRSVLNSDGRSLKIWDSERGAPWNSRYVETYLNRGGSFGPEVDNFLDIHHNLTAIDAAKQMPMIFAADIFDEVETLFWFHGNDALAQDNSRLIHRWGLFDILSQPGPQIASYDFMVETLGHASPVNNVDDESGLRAYFFSKGGDAIVLVYNWQEKPGSLSVTGYSGTVKAYDVFGRTVTAGSELPITGAPLYVVLSGVEAGRLSLEKGPEGDGAFELGVKK